MTIIICPNCKQEVTIDNTYDEDFDTQITCTHCNFTVAKWCFTFMEEIADGEK